MRRWLSNWKRFFWLNIICAVVTLAETIFLVSQGQKTLAGVFCTATYLVIAFLNALQIPKR